MSLIIKERKTFICELSRCTASNDDLYKISNETTLFSHIWLQGIVFKVKKKR
jgi:hypothetical protein